MADLLPTLLSDDEGVLGEESGSEDDEDTKLNNDFEFGGLMGEDSFLASSSSSSSRAKVNGWSYQNTLDSLERSKLDTPSTAVPRVDVASLISAKKKALKNTKKKNGHDNEKVNNETETKASKKVIKQNDSKNSGKDEAKASEFNSNDISSNSDEDSDDKEVNKAENGIVDNDDEDKKSGSETGSESESSDSDDEDDNSSVEENNDHPDVKDELKTRTGFDGDDGDFAKEKQNVSSDNDDEVENEKAKAFFDSNPQYGINSDEIDSFSQLSLSRPILRGIAAMGFVQPTPIQAAVLPLALQGRDICASAVTGSGKTAAFCLPILERLLHRYSGRTKAIILTPTRELAAQCLGMMTTLMQFTQLTACLIVGGSKNVTTQTAELRARPDIVVATPGRLLDHILNTAGFSVEEVEFLVLDEADRLLDLGFADEVNELIRACPQQRQTLLFSATMNTKVDDLASLSLKRPIRVRISDRIKEDRKDLEVAPRLEQEFVRIRPSNEGVYREAILLSLLHRTFRKHVIVFFDTKVAAHRLMIICGLCGIKCAELHGNLTQAQRLQALEDFRDSRVDVLLATDLAARGLDISSVRAVINFEMPSQLETYIHRIGRTARAGRGGSSCTLISESRRILMKDLIKRTEKQQDNKAVIRSRTVPNAVVKHFAEKIKDLETHVDEILQAEAVARLDRVAEMEAIKAQNVLSKSDEIMSRPKREWFTSKAQKEASAATAAEKKKQQEERAFKGTHRMSSKKRRAREAMEALSKEASENDDGEAEGVKPKKQKLPSQKLVARTHKKDEREKVSANASEPIKRKKARRLDASGSSLFDEVTKSTPQMSEKKKAAERPTHFKFEEQKPRTKKLNKKKSHNAFKSKSKHKRRK